MRWAVAVLVIFLAALAILFVIAVNNANINPPVAEIRITADGVKTCIIKDTLWRLECVKLDKPIFGVYSTCAIKYGRMTERNGPVVVVDTIDAVVSHTLEYKINDADSVYTQNYTPRYMTDKNGDTVAVFDMCSRQWYPMNRKKR
jgi:hypothetical protein